MQYRYEILRMPLALGIDLVSTQKPWGQFVIECAGWHIQPIGFADDPESSRGKAQGCAAAIGPTEDGMLIFFCRGTPCACLLLFLSGRKAYSTKHLILWLC